MTDRDDCVIDLAGSDAAVDRLLAGGLPSPAAPAWCRDAALLVRAAHAPARPDELAREDEIVGQMRALLLAERAGTDGAAAAAPSHEQAVTDLGTYRARHSRHYRAKHAAERMAASRHPAVRTLGRVLAMKAAAVTTAAAMGVAAAAATTGIVATVVVPALERDVPQEQVPPTERAGRPRATGGQGDRPAAPDAERPPVGCPAPLTACVPASPAHPGAVPAPSTTTTTTQPTDAAAETAPTTAPTTTTAPPTTTTTEPPRTTVDPPPTTATLPAEPQPQPTALTSAAGVDGPGDPAAT